MHRRPCHPWTAAELAVEVGASRSVLAEAARLLQTTRNTVLNVAADVGYESEAAFNRAFKREFGLPPAQYRRKLAANGVGPARAVPNLPEVRQREGTPARR